MATAIGRSRGRATRGAGSLALGLVTAMGWAGTARAQDAGPDAGTEAGSAATSADAGIAGGSDGATGADAAIAIEPPATTDAAASEAPIAGGDAGASVVARPTSVPSSPSSLRRVPAASQARDQERPVGQDARREHTSWLSRLHVEGFVDVYAMVHLQEPEGLERTGMFGDGDPSIRLRAFDARPAEIALAYAELAVWMPAEPVGFRIDLGFGPTAWTVHAGERGPDDFEIGTAIFNTIQQAYGTALLPVGRGLVLDVGKFVAPFGLELIEARDGWAYSRSVVFTHALPFYHFGIHLGYTASAAFGADLYLVNGWNNVFESNTAKTFGIRLRGRFGDVAAWTLGYLGGPEDREDEHFRHCASLTLTVRPVPALSLGLDAVVGADAYVAGYSITGDELERDSTWMGATLAMRYAVSEVFAAAVRGGVLRDDGGLATGEEQTLYEATFTLELRYATNMIVRLEYRHDQSSEEPFVDDAATDSAEARLTGSQDTFTLAAIVGF
ncbi:MAG: porin [Deltaproteobacteria bacterium]|nr:porin [Deltaproteobacteria bacterium]